MNRLMPSLVVLFLPILSQAAEQIYAGYQWESLGQGVYLHRASNPLAGPVDGNSIIIVNDDGVVVVDTHINPAAARAVIAKIRKITDKPVTHIVNTHWHDDHTNGNHAFRMAYPNARIIAHTQTLASLRKEWEPMEEQRKSAYAALEASDILAAADQIAETDPQKATGYRVYAGYLAALKPELATLELVYPDQVFQERLDLELGNRTVVLEWLGQANTMGDVTVWLPSEKILITGDVVVAPIPFAFDSPMGDWVETLERIQALKPTTIIPGHGPVQNGDDYVGKLAKLLTETIEQVRNARERGVDFEGLSDAVDLSHQMQLFVGSNAELTYAWNTYFLGPGLKSAWVSLGYPIVENAEKN